MGRGGKGEPKTSMQFINYPNFFFALPRIVLLHFSLLRVYSMWLEAVNNNRDDDGRKWCRDHFLHHRNLKTARSIADQLTGIMKMLKLPIISCAENTRGGSRRLSSSSSSKEGDSGKRRRLAEVDVNIDLDYSSILKALCSGYYMNTAKRHPSKPFYHLYSILKFSGKSSTSSSSSSSTMSKAISFEAGTDAVTVKKINKPKIETTSLPLIYI